MSPPWHWDTFHVIRNCYSQVHLLGHQCGCGVMTLWYLVVNCDLLRYAQNSAWLMIRGIFFFEIPLYLLEETQTSTILPERNFLSCQAYHSLAKIVWVRSEEKSRHHSLALQSVSVSCVPHVVSLFYLLNLPEVTVRVMMWLMGA